MQLLTETRHMEVLFLIYQAKGFQDALVMERIIPVQNMLMEHTSDALPQKLTSLKHRWEGLLSLGKSRNQHNGR